MGNDSQKEQKTGQLIANSFTGLINILHNTVILICPTRTFETGSSIIYLKNESYIYQLSTVVV